MQQRQRQHQHQQLGDAHGARELLATSRELRRQCIRLQIRGAHGSRYVRRDPLLPGSAANMKPCAQGVQQLEAAKERLFRVYQAATAASAPRRAAAAAAAAAALQLQLQPEPRRAGRAALARRQSRGADGSFARYTRLQTQLRVPPTSPAHVILPQGRL
jgi:hypothetical protein